MRRGVKGSNAYQTASPVQLTTLTSRGSPLYTNEALKKNYGSMELSPVVEEMP
jgi:hypothetical protein